MTKDNLLFSFAGLVVGFVAAWLMFETVTQRQPPRLTPNQLAALSSGQPLPGPNGGPSMGAPQAGASGGPQAGGAPSGPGGLDLSRMESLQQQLQSDPQNPDLMLALAHETYDIAKQVPNPAGSRPLWEQARDLYSQYLQLRPEDPNLPNILSDLGVSYQELGENDQALEIFRHVQEIAPTHWQSLFNEVFVLAFKKKDFDEAAKVMEKLKQMQPNNPDVQSLAAAVEEQRKAA